MRTKLFFLLTTMFLCNSYKCLTNTQNELSSKLLAPSPEASSITRYGAHPVSHYTGLPQISIPLYNLKADNVDVGISLSYHASGIKVDDIGSSAGLGWNINAGGTISLEVKGTRDIIMDMGRPEFVRLKSLSFVDFTMGDIFLEPNLPYSDFKTVAIQPSYVDMEADLYNYNFCGYSGKFLIDNDLKLIFISNNNGLVGEYDINNNRFIFKDKFGNSYVFGDVEFSSSQNFMYNINYTNTSITNDNYLGAKFGFPSPAGNTTNAITAWNLSKITNKNYADDINFYYYVVEETNITRINGSINSFKLKAKDSNSSCSEMYHERINGWVKINSNNSQSFNNSIIKNNAKKIKQITYKNSTVFFNYSDREDNSTSVKIESIKVTNSANTLVTEWKFGYKYNESLWEKTEKELAGNHYSFSNNPLNKRLLLKSLQRTNGNFKNESYEFEYYNEDEKNLPYRFGGKGVDHWGYFNSYIYTSEDANNVLFSFPKYNDGQISSNQSNADFIEQFGLSFSPSENPKYQAIEWLRTNKNVWAKLKRTYSNGLMGENFPGSIKDPNIDFTKTLTLKKIKHPTAGETKFDYEENRYSSINGSTINGVSGGLRVKSIIDISNTDTVKRSYQYEGGVAYNVPNYIERKYDIQYDQYFNTQMSSEFALKNYSDFECSLYGEQIGYSKVKEIHVFKNDTRKNYSNTYYYYTPSDFRDEDFIGIGMIQTHTYVKSGFVSLISLADSRKAIRPFNGVVHGNSFKRGLVKKIETVNDQNSLIKREDFLYEFIESKPFYSNIILPVKNIEVCNYSYEIESLYGILIYKHETGKVQLVRKETFENLNNNTISNTVLYTYDDITENVKSETTYGSNNTVYKTQYKYINDFSTNNSSNLVSRMIERNMIGWPLETTYSIDGKITNAIAIKFKNWSSHTTEKLHISDFYKLNIGNPINDYKGLSLSENDNYILDNRMIRNIEYTYYDDGKIKEQRHLNTGVVTTYLWSYNREYIVAKFENVSFGMLCGPLSAIWNNLYSSIIPTREQIEQVRLAHGYFPTTNMQITTYTYKPLVGMTSATDPRGVTTYYEYDEFNRLKQTYIIEGGVKKILQDLQYNYKN